MRNFYFKIIIIYLVSHFGFAQQMPIDFSDSSENFTAFSGSGFSFNTDPLDSNNDVGQFFNDGTVPWQGFLLNLNRSIDLDFQKTITLSFYAFDPNGHTILLKLENGVNADVEVVQSKSSSGWTHNIIFDFSNAVLSSDGVTPVNASGTYDRLVIFIDGGVATSGTYLIDNIDDGSVEIDLNAIDVEYTDLIWADEFDTPGDVNPLNWHKQTQVIIPGIGWANSEEQHYTARIDNSFVDNLGNLNIVAKREMFNSQGITKNYTSARLNSKFAFTYGRIDVRAKLPAWDGTWPAIWTLGKNINENGGYWDNQGFGTTPWPECGEIDVMEHGLGAINHASSALHTNSSSGATVNYASQEISDVAVNWHIYSVNWSPNQITFLVDNVPFYTYNPTVKNLNTWPFNKDQYILLNVAMGGISVPNGEVIDPNVDSDTMIIDYVRVYQNNSLSLDEKNTKEFRIYPNPTNEIINIKTKSSVDLVEVYDVFGKLILRQSEGVNVIHVENFDSGLYLLNIYSGSTKTIKKVIVN